MERTINIIKPNPQNLTKHEKAKKVFERIVRDIDTSLEQGKTVVIVDHHGPIVQEPNGIQRPAGR